MMNTCPYATLMAGTLDSRQWTVNELVQSIRCYRKGINDHVSNHFYSNSMYNALYSQIYLFHSCYHNVVNTWAPCIRRSAQINLHPNLTSRCRQMWYLVIQLLKYCNMTPQFATDETFTFKGETELHYHTYSPTSADRRDLLSNVPRRLQTANIVTRGMLYFAFICENRRCNNLIFQAMKFLSAVADSLLDRAFFIIPALQVMEVVQTEG